MDRSKIVRVGTIRWDGDAPTVKGWTFDAGENGYEQKRDYLFTVCGYPLWELKIMGLRAELEQALRQIVIAEAETTKLLSNLANEIVMLRVELGRAQETIHRLRSHIRELPNE